MNEPYAGYLFSYFIGEEFENGEQVYFALSEGNDPLHWRELNQGRPVLYSTMGEQGVRDPYIIRSHTGDRFYLVATDLKIGDNNDWVRAVKSGSHAIMIWESRDLIQWSEQRMIEVAPPEAGCTWAPEVFHGEHDSYYVFWSSSLIDQAGEPYQRMMYATTKDFRSFSEPTVFMDYGYAVIDTTIIEHQGRIYRISKGDRHIFQESGDSFLDRNFTMINDNVEEQFMTRGEGPILFKSNLEEKWYLFIDEYGMRGYLPLETTDLASGRWSMPKSYRLPASPRHGSIIPVTKSEYDQLLRAYG